MNKKIDNFTSLLKKALTNSARTKLNLNLTNCFRIFDSKGDGYPDIIIDNFNGHWLVQSTNSQKLASLPDFSGYQSLYAKELSQFNKDSPQWIAGTKVDHRFTVRENGLEFWIDFNCGYSQGLFLDQRESRYWVLNNSRKNSILNLFSYTCGFSVAVAKGGGHCTSIDLSKNSLTWGKDNFQLNKLDPKDHEFIADDCLDVLSRFQKKGRLFDGIILDPPSFSRNKKGKVMSLERDLEMLVNKCSLMLKGSGSWLLVSCNLRKLSKEKFKSTCKKAVGKRNFKYTELQMPPDFTDVPYLHACRIELL